MQNNGVVLNSGHERKGPKPVYKGIPAFFKRLGETTRNIAQNKQHASQNSNRDPNMKRTCETLKPMVSQRAVKVVTIRMVIVHFTTLYNSCCQ
jgi:hypothetical protein